MNNLGWKLFNALFPRTLESFARRFAALELLANHPVMVILSDQRMPNMTGTEFLSRVKIMHPRTVRIILSGYADLNSITEAINKGEIYKFRTKPWDDDELRNDVREAFLHYESLERRNPLNVKNH